jgi:MFS family permease
MLPAALRHPRFVWYFIAFAVSAIGTWVQAFAQSWTVYERSGNKATALGWLSLAFAGPMILITPFGGMLADRWNKRRILITTQSLQAACSLVLGIVALRGQLRPVHLLTMQVVSACLLAVDNPARQSMIPELVDKPALPSALSLTAATFTGAALLGPAIGRMLYAHMPIAWLFVFNAATFALPVAAILTLPRSAGSAPAQTSSMFFREVLRYVWQTPRLRTVLATAVAIALVGRSYTHVLAAYARESLAVHADGFGHLLTFGGIGALAGAVLMTWGAARFTTPSDIALHSRLCVLVSMFAVLLTTLSQLHRLNLAAGCVAALGLTATVFTTTTATALQQAAPPQLRGRILALHVVTVIGLPYLGATGIAAIAHATNVSRALLATGLTCAVLALVGYSVSRTPK